jgi:hypothetical protein
VETRFRMVDPGPLRFLFVFPIDSLEEIAYYFNE